MSWNDPNWLDAARWYHEQRRGRTLIVAPSGTRTTPDESIEAFSSRIMRAHRERNGPTKAEKIAAKMRADNGQ